MRFWATALLAVMTATAAEVVLLKSGFQVAADRHEVDGDAMKLYRGEGYVTVPLADVAEIEATAPEVKDAPEPEPAPAARTARSPRELVEEAAARYGLPAEFVHSVAQVESAYKADAISPKGARGIMQLMPGTAASLDADPQDPEQNVAAGTRLLRELLLKYKDHPDQVRRALAAYNAGAGAVKRYDGVPPYRETRTYVERVLERYRKLSK
jgi:soluble lytic murein transglycosylase-like protein